MTIRMPAEWEPHEWMWIGFPWNAAEWGDEDTLARAQAQIAAFADTIRAGGRGEDVRLVCNDAANAERARTLLQSDAGIVIERIGDIWLRDTGPICVTLPEGYRALVDFRFNGWGGKYEMPGDEDIGQGIAELESQHPRLGEGVYQGYLLLRRDKSGDILKAVPGPNLGESNALR